MGYKTTMIPGLAILGLLLFAADPANARIWVVAKDGSGDFSVIQEAVDAASSGDEIHIGPGRYDEYQSIQGGVYWYDVHVLISNGTTLTFRGAGSDETIIGPTDPDIHTNMTYGIGAIHGVGIVVSGVGFENCSQFSIGISSGFLEVERCRFYYSGQPTSLTKGVDGGFTEGAVIRDSQFIGLNHGIATINSPGGVLIERCTFESSLGVYAWTTGSQNVQVLDCGFTCNTAGIAFGPGAGGTIDNCHIINCGLELTNTHTVTVTNNVVTRDDHGLAFRLTNNSPVVIENNVFESNWRVIHLASYGLGTIRNNHIIRSAGGEYWVYCPPHPSFSQVIDLSGNWWGTTDTNVIAEGIYDCNDNPQSYHCVIFEPLADGPVPVQQQTWTEVKGLFRD